MKRFKIAVALILALSLVMAFTACNEKFALQTPEGLYLDENFTLTWREVADARGYEVEISSNGEAATLRKVTRPVISLSDLEAGEYTVRVRAYGGANKDKFSAYTLPFSFSRDFESGLLYGLVNGSEYTVTGIGTANGDVVIEDYYHGRPVTAIADNAFRGRALVKTVKVGANVKSIGANAFYNCVNMTSVSLPEGLSEIGESAFQGCTSLESIDVPAGVKVLNSLAFGYCRGLKTVTLHEGLREIGDSAFYECNSVTSFKLPDSLEYIYGSAFSVTSALEHIEFGKGLRYIGAEAFVGSGVTDLDFKDTDAALSIASAAFEGCSFKEIALPEGATAIGTYAFYGCKELAKVELPSTITSIGGFAFEDTAIVAAQSEGASFIYVDDWLVGGTELLKTNIKYLKGENDPVSGDTNNNKIPDSWEQDPDFRMEDKSEELRQSYFEIKSGTVGIADYAFVPASAFVSGAEAYSNLYDIILPNSVKYIGQSAFTYATKLYKFECTDSSSLLSIGASAFEQCYSLSNISLKEGLEVIESGAFAGCSNLRNNSDNPEKITPRSVKRIGAFAFYDTAIWKAAAGTGGLVVAGNWIVGFDSEGRWQFDGSLESYEQGNIEIVGVSDYALYQCQNLQSINIENVSKIGRSAFSGCTSLISVQLNNNLSEIPAFAFYNCTSLLMSSFPRDLRTIGRYAFFKTAVQNVDLGGTRLTSIGDHAFYGCENMTTLTLSSRMTEIEPYTFYGCKLLENVSIPNGVNSIGERAFGYCSSLGEVEFGTGLKEIGEYAFRNCDALAAIELAHVENIASHAFYGCTSVADLSLGDSVKTIGAAAFEGMSITRLVLPSSVESVGDAAFRGCVTLKTAYIAGKPSYVGANAFGDCNGLTIYSAPSREDATSWNIIWNSTFRPTFYSCTFDGETLLAVTTDIDNGTAFMGVSDPYREGYGFAGWSRSEGGSAEFATAELGGQDGGITLYAVYNETPSQGVEE